MKVSHRELHVAPLNSEEAGRLTNFLSRELGSYGDPEDQIQMCVDYAQTRGGTLTTAHDDDGHLLGAAITNETGMAGYIPAHILVYIAVAEEGRGKGVGRSILDAITAELTGGIALHVDENNPARGLYERCGFEAKYIEMRRA